MLRWAGRAVFSFVLTSMAMLGQSPATSKLEAEILEFEKKYNGSYAANDLATYFDCLAPDFIQFLPSGRTDKASYQTSWTRSIQNGTKVQAADFSEMKIQISPSGDSAVASYILHVVTQSARGTSDEYYQESDVLFKRDGKWTLVNMHYSPKRNRQQ